jgi:F-type H+-transporting ATPase subunit epsilon
MKLSVETPEKVFYDGEAESLILTTPCGQMGVLDSHELTVVALDTGPLKIKKDGNWREAALSGGFAHIKGRQVVILADTAEWPEEIELARAVADLHRAEEIMRAHASEMEYLDAIVSLKKAVLRISMAERGKRI